MNRLSCVLTVALAATLQSGTLWASDFGRAFLINGSGQNSIAQAMTTDSSGNVYVAGHFKDSLDFDPGAGVTTLTSAGDFDGVVMKLSPAGALIWVKQISGTGVQEFNGVAVDGTGNVYLTGYCNLTTDLDPGPGTFSITTHHIFALKLDSNGDFVWASVAATPHRSKAITLDGSGNVLIVGGFSGTIDFDPGPGTFNLTAFAANSDAYLWKLDSTGAFVAAFQFGGALLDVAHAVACDSLNNVYIGGSFSDTADLDPTAGTSTAVTAASFDMFIVKLSSAGAFVWARSFGGGAQFDEVRALTTDSNNDVYATGRFKQTVDFDPGPGTHIIETSGNESQFVLKLDTAGNFVFAKAVKGGSDSNDQLISNGITLDAARNIYTTGSLKTQGGADFDPGPGEFLLKSVGGSFNAFVTKLDSSGNFVWAKQLAGSNEGGNAISVDSTGGVYAAGRARSLTDFGLVTVGDNVSLVRLNQLPVVDLSATAAGLDHTVTFNQFRGAVPIVDAATLVVKHERHDVLTIASATVVLTNAFNGAAESLAVNTGATGLTASYNSGTATLSISGVASLAAYQQVLRTATYNNTAASDINVTQRRVTFVVNDGTFSSFSAASLISIVKNKAPTLVAAASPNPVAVGLPVSFTATGSDPEGDALTYSYTFGDGASATQQNTSHAYAARGIYQATVTVTDAFGASASGAFQIAVGRPPLARFTTSDVVGIVGVPFTFDAALSSDPENAIVDYNWNFGDGSPNGKGQVISRIYTAAGTYLVTLTLTDAEGLTFAISRQVVILPADQLGLFNAFIKYKVKWDRGRENVDSLTLEANINVGDAAIGDGTAVALEVAGQRFEGTVNARLQSKSANLTWQLTANKRKQAAGEVFIKMKATRASLGFGFNQAGALAAGEDGDPVEVNIPVRLEIAGRVFEVQIESEFKFSKDGKKATGNGEGP